MENTRERYRVIPPAPPRRRWFRFSLRTLFVLVTLFCVWLGVQVKWIHDRHRFLEWSQRNGGPRYIRNDMPEVGEYARPAPWSLRLFGEPGISFFGIYPLDPDPQNTMRDIETLFPEAEWGIDEMRVSDEILKVITEMSDSRAERH